MPTNEQAITLTFDMQTEQLISQRYPKACKPLIDLVQPPHTVNDFAVVFSAVGLTRCDVTVEDATMRLVFPLADFVRWWGMVKS